MTIDYKKFNYVKVGHYTNLMVQIPKERTETGPAKMCAFMEPLIAKLALTHPEWTIVGVEPRWHIHDEQYQMQRFIIYAGQEMVGRINRDGWQGHDYKYEIFNERVRQARERSGGMRTKDMKKALKAIDGFFAPTTDAERRAKAVSEMGGHLQSAVWRTQRELNDVFTGIIPAVARYISNNMEKVRPELELLGVDANVLDRLDKRLEPYSVMEQISTARSNRTGTTVVLVEDRYMLIHDRDPLSPVVVTAQQLDPAMAGKIGILKVFEDDTEPLDGVGMRLNSTTFYILP
jgi:hypothetical protein